MLSVKSPIKMEVLMRHLLFFVASSVNSGFVKSDCDHGIMTAIKLSRHPESLYKCTSAFTSMLGSALQHPHGHLNSSGQD